MTMEILSTNRLTLQPRQAALLPARTCYHKANTTRRGTPVPKRSQSAPLPTFHGWRNRGGQRSPGLQIEATPTAKPGNSVAAGIPAGDFLAHRGEQRVADWL